MNLKWALRSCEEDEAIHHGYANGNIPSWLQGSKVLGVGSALYQVGDFKMKSLIDGYGMLVSLTFESESEVIIQTKYLQSDAYKKAIAASKPIYTEFASRGQPDPSKNFVLRLLSTFKPETSDNCNHNLCCYKKNIMAMTPTACYRLVDPLTLETKNKIDMSKNGVAMLSPHPQLDSDGSLYNIGIAFQPSVKYVVLKSASSSQTEDCGASDSLVIASVSPTYKTKFSVVHSFSLTENYVIFIEYPSFASFMKMLTAIPSGKAFKDCMEWDPKALVRFFVIDKKSGRHVPVNYCATGFFLMHHINAFEDGDFIVVDVTAYTNEFFEDFSMDNLTSGDFNSTADGSQKRFALPLPKILEQKPKVNLVTLTYTTATAKYENDDAIFCVPESLFDPTVYKACFDNPTINSKVLGHPYQYYYGVPGFFNGSTSYSYSIVKANVKSKQLITYNFGENLTCVNCLFVPSPNSKNEDDGVILAIANSLNANHMDQLIIVDASNLTEIVRVPLPIHAPPMAHLIYLTENDTQ